MNSKHRHPGNMRFLAHVKILFLALDNQLLHKEIRKLCLGYLLLFLIFILLSVLLSNFFACINNVQKLVSAIFAAFLRLCWCRKNYMRRNFVNAISDMIFCRCVKMLRGCPSLKFPKTLRKRFNWILY